MSNPAYRDFALSSFVPQAVHKRLYYPYLDRACICLITVWNSSSHFFLTARSGNLYAHILAMYKPTNPQNSEASISDYAFLVYNATIWSPLHWNSNILRLLGIPILLKDRITECCKTAAHLPVEIFCHGSVSRPVKLFDALMLVHSLNWFLQSGSKVRRALDLTSPTVETWCPSCLFLRSVRCVNYMS